MALEADLKVVGETGKVGEAVYLAQALDPDVIVVDVGTRSSEGVDIVRRLQAAAPTAAVVVLTLRGDRDTRIQAEKAGAQALVEKCGGAAELLRVIRELAASQPLESETGTSGLGARWLSAD
jgi:DNA-binding NarL/FixJ family response regulator